ncbi:MBL fold metallo-hydrolase [Rhodococcus aerolatus]
MSNTDLTLTHLGHACVLVELGGARILVDPGAFSSGFAELEGLDAVLLTHQHFDHVDTDALPGLLERNPGALLRADPQTAEQLGGGWEAVRPGSAFTVGGVQVGVGGGQHAVIHPDVPGIDNVAYLFGTDERPRAFLHPGDSFHVPEQAPDVLGLPTAAPWLKLSEAVDYLRAVAPRVVVPIHEAVLADPGVFFGIYEALVPGGTDWHVLPRGTADQL